MISSVPRRDADPSRAALAAGLAFVLLTGLALRLSIVPRLTDPVSPDEVYYWQAAKNMAAGRGMVTDIVWNYVHGVPDQTPVPSHGYWMPLMSWVLYPFAKLLGPSYASAQVCGMLLGLGLIGFAFALAWSWWRSLPAAVLAGLLIALSHTAALASVMGDTIVLCSLLVGGALWCMTPGLTGRVPHLVAAGIMSGLAHLTRNDAALVLVALVITYLWLRRRGAPVKPVYLAWFVAAHALVVAPWLIRNYVVFGGIAGAGLAKVALLPEYIDIFRVDLDGITLSNLISGKSVGELLALRVGVLTFMLTWAGPAINIGFYYLPVHAWRERFEDQIPFIAQVAVVTAVYWLLLPHLAMRGSHPKAAAVFCVYVAVGIAGGLMRQIGLQQRAGSEARHTWMPAAAFGAIVLLLVHYSTGWLVDALRKTYEDPYYYSRQRIAALVPELRPGPIISDDPWRLHHLTGLACYQLPSDGAEATMRLVQRVGARRVMVRGAYRERMGLPPFQVGPLPPDVPRLQFQAWLPTVQPGGLFVYRPIMLRPGVIEANHEGKRLAEQGEPEAALAQFRRAAELQGRDGSGLIHRNIGKSLADLGRLDEAVRSFQRAVQIDPSDRMSRYAAAKYLMEIGRPEEAVPHLEQILTVEPFNGEASYKLAECLAQIRMSE